MHSFFKGIVNIWKIFRLRKDREYMEIAWIMKKLRNGNQIKVQGSHV